MSIGFSYKEIVPAPCPQSMRSEDRPFVSDCTLKLPARFRKRALNSYFDDYRDHGHEAANGLYLRLSHLSERVGSIFNISSDEDILQKARRIAREYSLSYLRYGYDYAWKNVATRNVDEEYLPDIRDFETLDRIAKRLADEKWWRRAMRAQRKQAIETMARSINLVNRHSDLYATTESVKLRENQKARTRALLKECHAVNEVGYECTLEDLANISVSNPKIRRAELFTRLAGFEKFAKKQEHVGEFWTFTCPSKMHSSLSKSGKRNPKHDGTTPKEAQSYLTKVWSRVRSKLNRQGIRIYGFRVAEPNHDATPHWHFVLFMENEHRDIARDIMRQYALAMDGNESGAKKHRFKAMAIDWKKGSATGYLAKYICKNIDGVGVGQDLYGNDAVSSATRVDTWASTWGIRQFQQIGGPPVTVWRQLRKLREKQSDGELEPYRKSADDGDWCGFLELMADRPVEVYRRFNEKLGRYDEPIGEQIVGLSLNDVIYITRLHEWKIEHRPSNGEDCVVFAFSNPPTDKRSQTMSSGEFLYQLSRAKRALEFCQ